jgi:hypothetical protein
MTWVDIGVIIFCYLFSFIYLLRDWHSKSNLTGGDVLVAMFLSLFFGMLLTPIVLVIMMFSTTADIFNKIFDKVKGG